MEMGAYDKRGAFGRLVVAGLSEMCTQITSDVVKKAGVNSPYPRVPSFINDLEI